MLSILFWILMIGIFGRLIAFSFKFSWKLAKVLFTLIILPLSILGLFFWGFLKIALPVLIIVGIVSLFTDKKAAA